MNSSQDIHRRIIELEVEHRDLDAVIDVLLNDTDDSGAINPTSVTITQQPLHGEGREVEAFDRECGARRSGCHHAGCHGRACRPLRPLFRHFLAVYAFSVWACDQCSCSQDGPARLRCCRATLRGCPEPGLANQAAPHIA